jgi:hypothetical protein
MKNQLEKYGIRLSLEKKGDQLENTLLTDFQQELSIRTRIDKFEVFLKDNRSLEFYIETQGHELNPTAQQMADEILGIACAVMQDVDGLIVTIINSVILHRC